MTTAANHEARTELAVLTARVEELIREVREYREGSDTRQKDHSRKLDEYGLAIARLEQGERERAELRASIEKLKTEQRLWTGMATLLAAVASFLGLRQ